MTIFGGHALEKEKMGVEVKEFAIIPEGKKGPDPLIMDGALLLDTRRVQGWVQRLEHRRSSQPPSAHPMAQSSTASLKQTWS